MNWECCVGWLVNIHCIIFSMAIMLLHIKHNALSSNSITEEFIFPWITFRLAYQPMLSFCPILLLSHFTQVWILTAPSCLSKRKEQECRSAGVLWESRGWDGIWEPSSLASHLRTPALKGPGTQITLSRKWWSRCEDFPWWWTGMVCIQKGMDEARGKHGSKEIAWWDCGAIIMVPWGLTEEIILKMKSRGAWVS